MNADAASLPKVHLDRSQTVRMVIVGTIVFLALARVVPDFGRIFYPLTYFGYRTDWNAVVTYVAPAQSTPSNTQRVFSRLFRPAGKAPPATSAPISADRIEVGDRVRIDRIKPFDRKPGLALRGYTFDNPQRYLPIERDGEERILHLVPRGVEAAATRLIDMIRIVVFVVAVALGALLFLMRPSIATGAFFVFSLAAVEAPATFIDTLTTNPWREVLDGAGDVLRGVVRPALLLFALCLIDGDRDVDRERVFAWAIATVALPLAVLNAYAGWRVNYEALPAEGLHRVFTDVNTAFSVIIAIAFAVAFARAGVNDRHRIGWIVAAFLFAGAMRWISDTLFPGHIPLWLNSILISMSIVPIIAVWIAVIRHRFFNVDFVVSRAVVYVALTATLIGTIGIVEEIGTYLFYQNTDIAYIVLIGISLVVGSFTGKLAELLRRLTDRFIFRDRLEQRQALEFIAGYILDAENVEDVYRALLQDAAHALKLSFSGILGRQAEGGYALVETYNWPPNFDLRLAATDELTRAITRTRGALTFSSKESRLIQEQFAAEGLTFAAPLLFNRTVSGIVVYGHNVSGLDLDPEERELLVRVVAHASIALTTIELNRYRRAIAPSPLPSRSS